jgi:hypothetical protein
MRVCVHNDCDHRMRIESGYAMAASPSPSSSSGTTHAEAAVAAAVQRGFWSAYPESPSPEGVRRDRGGRGAGCLPGSPRQPVPLDQPGTDGWVATERSPYGPELGVSHPHPDVRRCWRR